jgi:predicted aspartyl protease
MNKILSLSLQVALGFITTFFFLIGYYALIEKSFLNDYIIYIGAILIFIFVLLFRKKKTYFFSTLTLVFLFIGVNAFNYYYNNLYKEGSINWNSNNHSTIIPFYSSKSGHLFIKTKINEEIKYLGFDTGAGISALNEKYINSKTEDVIYIINSQNEKYSHEIHKINKLSLGNIDFRQISYIPLQIREWDNSKGIFNSLKNKDSIGGILGNNIINSFVWDFDMNSTSVKITDHKFSEKTSNATIIPLTKSEMSWKVEIKVNDKSKDVVLDTGSSLILSMTDSLPVYKDGFKITRSGNGINSYKGNSENREAVSFVDLKIGDLLFKETIISSESKSNLLGIPLFWEYERIVLDFIDHKMYVFEKSTNKNARSITNINKSSKNLIEKKTIKQKPMPNNGYN